MYTHRSKCTNHWIEKEPATNATNRIPSPWMQRQCTRRNQISWPQSITLQTRTQPSEKSCAFKWAGITKISVRPAAWEGSNRKGSYKSSAPILSLWFFRGLPVWNIPSMIIGRMKRTCLHILLVLFVALLEVVPAFSTYAESFNSEGNSIASKIMAVKHLSLISKQPRIDSKQEVEDLNIGTSSGPGYITTISEFKQSAKNPSIQRFRAFNRSKNRIWLLNRSLRCWLRMLPPVIVLPAGSYWLRYIRKRVFLDLKGCSRFRLSFARSARAHRVFCALRANI